MIQGGVFVCMVAAGLPEQSIRLRLRIHYQAKEILRA